MAFQPRIAYSVIPNLSSKGEERRIFVKGEKRGKLGVKEGEKGGKLGGIGPSFLDAV